jgi:hypothetical protein
MTDQGKLVFPVVHSLEGRPTDDGSALLVEATAFDGTVLRFAIPVDNVKHFIAFLLLWVGTMSQSDNGDSDAAHVGEGSLPIPATSIAIGEPNGDEGYIGISVGRAELIFSMPVSAFGELGQSLLMAGATSLPCLRSFAAEAFELYRWSSSRMSLIPSALSCRTGNR